MSIGFWQIIIVLLIVLIVFGKKGKISSFMSDIGRGIKSLKKEINDDDKPVR